MKTWRMIWGQLKYKWGWNVLFAMALMLFGSIEFNGNPVGEVFYCIGLILDEPESVNILLVPCLFTVLYLLILSIVYTSYFTMQLRHLPSEIKEGKPKKLILEWLKVFIFITIFYSILCIGIPLINKEYVKSGFIMCLPVIFLLLVKLLIIVCQYSILSIVILGILRGEKNIIKMLSELKGLLSKDFIYICGCMAAGKVIVMLIAYQLKLGFNLSNLSGGSMGLFGLMGSWSDSFYFMRGIEIKVDALIALITISYLISCEKRKLTARQIY